MFDTCDMNVFEPELHVSELNKAGEWLKVNPLVDSVECSVCGYQLQSEELKTPFCPWCGTKMKNWSDE